MYIFLYMIWEHISSDMLWYAATRNPRVYTLNPKPLNPRVYTLHP